MKLRLNFSSHLYQRKFSADKEKMYWITLCPKKLYHIMVYEIISNEHCLHRYSMQYNSYHDKISYLTLLFCYSIEYVWKRYTNLNGSSILKSWTHQFTKSIYVKMWTNAGRRSCVWWSNKYGWTRPFIQPTSRGK